MPHVIIDALILKRLLDRGSEAIRILGHGHVIEMFDADRAALEAGTVDLAATPLARERDALAHDLEELWRRAGHRDARDRVLACLDSNGQGTLKKTYLCLDEAAPDTVAAQRQEWERVDPRNAAQCRSFAQGMLAAVETAGLPPIVSGPSLGKSYEAAPSGPWQHGVLVTGHEPYSHEISRPLGQGGIQPFGPGLPGLPHYDDDHMTAQERQDVFDLGRHGDVSDRIVADVHRQIEAETDALKVAAAISPAAQRAAQERAERMERAAALGRPDPGCHMPSAADALKAPAPPVQKPADLVPACDIFASTVSLQSPGQLRNLLMKDFRVPAAVVDVVCAYVERQNAEVANHPDARVYEQVFQDRVAHLAQICGGLIYTDLDLLKHTTQIRAERDAAIEELKELRQEVAFINRCYVDNLDGTPLTEDAKELAERARLVRDLHIARSNQDVARHDADRARRERDELRESGRSLLADLARSQATSHQISVERDKLEERLAELGAELGAECGTRGGMIQTLNVQVDRLRFEKANLDQRIAELSTEIDQIGQIGRWETGVRNIVTILLGPSAPFEIPAVVEAVRELKADRDAWKAEHGHVVRIHREVVAELRDSLAKADFKVLDQVSRMAELNGETERGRVAIALMEARAVKAEEEIDRLLKRCAELIDNPACVMVNHKQLAFPTPSASRDVQMHVNALSALVHALNANDRAMTMVPPPENITDYCQQLDRAYEEAKKVTGLMSPFDPSGTPQVVQAPAICMTTKSNDALLSAVHDAVASLRHVSARVQTCRNVQVEMVPAGNDTVDWIRHAEQVLETLARQPADMGRFEDEADDLQRQLIEARQEIAELADQCGNSSSEFIEHLMELNQYRGRITQLTMAIAFARNQCRDRVNGDGEFQEGRRYQQRLVLKAIMDGKNWTSPSQPDDEGPADELDCWLDDVRRPVEVLRRDDETTDLET